MVTSLTSETLMFQGWSGGNDNVKDSEILHTKNPHNDLLTCDFFSDISKRPAWIARHWQKTHFFSWNPHAQATFLEAYGLKS